MKGFLVKDIYNKRHGGDSEKHKKKFSMWKSKRKCNC